MPPSNLLPLATDAIKVVKICHPGQQAAFKDHSSRVYKLNWYCYIQEKYFSPNNTFNVDSWES